MRRTLITLAGVALLAAPYALAAPGPFDASATKPLVKSYCPSTGPIVVNVTRDIAGHADAGLGGNAWAIDKYEERIVIRRVSTNVYCVAVQQNGAFVTTGGPSPGGTSFVSAGRTGTMMGSYKTNHFSAKFRPLVPTLGYIGRFEFGCDASFTCPGAVNWLTLYFKDVSGFALDYWQWGYQTIDGQIWANRSYGSYGDIAG